jgi:hypothetical protein
MITMKRFRRQRLLWLAFLMDRAGVEGDRGSDDRGAEKFKPA